MDFRNRQKAGAKIAQKTWGRMKAVYALPRSIWGNGFLIKGALQVYRYCRFDVCENFCKTCENHKKHGNMLNIHINKRLKIGDIR